MRGAIRPVVDIDVFPDGMHQGDHSYERTCAWEVAEGSTAWWV